MRTEAIAKIDQRISDVDFQGSFSIERRSGIPVQRLNSSVRDENRFGVVKVPQLKSLGSTQLPEWHDQPLENSGLEGLDHSGWLGSRPHGIQQRSLHSGANQD